MLTFNLQFSCGVPGVWLPHWHRNKRRAVSGTWRLPGFQQLAVLHCGSYLDEATWQKYVNGVQVWGEGE
jgi:hypothetical protein